MQPTELLTKLEHTWKAGKHTLFMDELLSLPPAKLAWLTLALFTVFNAAEKARLAGLLKEYAARE